MNRFDTCQQALSRLQMRRPEEALLQRVSQAVEQLMGRGLPDVESVARQLGMPPSTMRRRIKAATTLTAADYITTLRLSHALKLLEWWPEVSMTQVARQCGYADGAHLSHAFKRFFGAPPSRYLKTAHGHTPHNDEPTIINP